MIGLITLLQSMRPGLVDELPKLIPEAAGIPNPDWIRLARSTEAPSLDSLKSKSLSLLLMSLPVAELAEKNPDVLKDFRYLAERPPKPAELARVMWRSKEKGYATIAQPEFINHRSAKIEGETAHGFVGFLADDLYEGKVKYVGRKHGGQWRIEEFHLPNYGISIHRNEDGVWERMTKVQRGQPRSDGDTPAKNEG